MTNDADPTKYFAVLKLGNHCPNGSDDINKLIDNEDDVDGNFSTQRGAQARTGWATHQVRSTATLEFCYFRHDGASMTAFPDLGFRYAVFHQFTGEQPPWVLAKSWLFSNDEHQGQQKNQYMPPDAPFTTEFEQVIENPGNNTTYFDIAWVR